MFLMVLVSVFGLVGQLLGSEYQFQNHFFALKSDFYITVAVNVNVVRKLVDNASKSFFAKTVN